MGYTIQYSPEASERYPISVRSKKWKYFLTVCLTVLLLFLAVRYRAELLRLLLPGDPDVTAGAFAKLVTEIRAGNAGDAVAAFCWEILDHAAG